MKNLDKSLTPEYNNLPNNNIPDNNINNISDSNNRSKVINKKNSNKVINKEKYNYLKDKDITELSELEICKKYNITLQDKKFCDIYTSEIEFYGNGVRSYIEAFNIDLTEKNGYNNARARACVLLTKSNILAYINARLEVTALNNVAVDKQLAFLMTQNADFGTKLGAIKEFNALCNRIKQRIDVTTNGKDISTISEEEKNKLSANLQKFNSYVNSL